VQEVNASSPVPAVVMNALPTPIKISLEHVYVNLTGVMVIILMSFVTSM